MAHDPLDKLYPVWRAKCLESAAWLRSGKKYEDWCRQMNIPVLPLEERELRAARYEARALQYATLTK